MAEAHLVASGRTLSTLREKVSLIPPEIAEALSSFFRAGKNMKVQILETFLFHRLRKQVQSSNGQDPYRLVQELWATCGY